MKSLLLFLLASQLIVYVLTSSFSLSLNQQVSAVQRNEILAKLRTFQQRMYSRQFRTKKDQFQLTTFKEQLDRGTLAYTALIKVGQTGMPMSNKEENRMKGQNKNSNIQTQQEFNVLLDTGSTNVFLLGSECSTSTCEHHKRYNTKYARNKWNTQLDEIGYISGSSIGQILADDFQIGKMKIKDQPIHVGLKVNIPVIETAKWDGIVGLGYWHAETNLQLEQDKSIIDNIIDRNLIQRKLFTYYILPEQGGRATFGEILKDVVQNENDIVYANVNNINDEAQWIITLKNIHLEFNEVKKIEKRFLSKVIQKQKVLSLKEKKEQKIKDVKIQLHVERQKEWMNKRFKKENPCANGCKLLIDTGTYLNYIPTRWFTTYLPKTQFDFDKMFCKNSSTFPNIVLTIIGVNGDFELKLKPEMYLENYGEEDCTNNFTPDTVEVDTVTLGQGFLRHFYTIFDFGKKQKQIGFYKL